jgi:hypothetical protein
MLRPRSASSPTSCTHFPPPLHESPSALLVRVQRVQRVLGVQRVQRVLGVLQVRVLPLHVVGEGQVRERSSARWTAAAGFCLPLSLGLELGSRLVPALVMGAKAQQRAPLWFWGVPAPPADARAPARQPVSNKPTPVFHRRRSMSRVRVRVRVQAGAPRCCPASNLSPLLAVPLLLLLLVVVVVVVVVVVAVVVVVVAVVAVVVAVAGMRSPSWASALLACISRTLACPGMRGGVVAAPVWAVRTTSTTTPTPG